MMNSLTTSLDSATAAIGTALSQLSSGQRIVSPAVDPAGSQIATQLMAQISSTGAALSNIYDASSLAQTSGGALSEVSDTLQQMRVLAVQAGDGAYNASDRQALQAQFTQLSGTLDALAAQSQYNGKNLLDGSLNTTIQVGTNPGQTVSLALGNMSSSGLGVAGQSITTVSGAQSALSAIDQAISVVSAQSATVGAVQSSLDSASASLSSASLNLSSSLSGIADANIARASSDMSSATVKQQLAIHAIKLYNANQSQVLGLIAPPA